ncbi:alkaline phosphatase-like [Ischnura elegans]|uniref:alkaline phosphatase-like n=1 Tax=Ischnura elegans TaxID=197161 RepID=UPI001ED86D17|nr:alkaline phosphatase-like [Ischnura elegans]
MRKADSSVAVVALTLVLLTLLTELTAAVPAKRAPPASGASPPPTANRTQAEEEGDVIMHPRSSRHQLKAGSKQSLDETDPNYWHNVAKTQLKNTLKRELIVTPAKSTILFLGDGMSIPTITAARIFEGQRKGLSGEGHSLFFEKFPYIGLSKTYSVSDMVTDSAASGTAYLCGVKTNQGVLGLTAAVSTGDCKASQNTSTHVHSILKWAQDAGMSTGVVTTTRVTHASPAAGYAHVANRDWENDADVAADKQDPHACPDIAQQLVHGDTGRRLNVVMGGGRRNFLPKDAKDEEGRKGKRLDGRNLIAEWLKEKSHRGLRSLYIWNRDQLKAVDDKTTDYLLGLFESSHMRYHLEANPSTEPTLAEMTSTAIKILSKNPRGYFLFVEGGLIDHGHHGARAQLALDETVEFADAVRTASVATSEKDTLIVVTADHAHTMSLAGYARRGGPILGIAGQSNKDKLPYSILAYSNGPGYKKPNFHGKRYDISHDNTDNVSYRFPSVAPMGAESHGGDDVAVFAKGPWAHIFSGNYELNYVMHAMCYASGIGPASNWS